MEAGMRRCFHIPFAALLSLAPLAGESRGASSFRLSFLTQEANAPRSVEYVPKTHPIDVRPRLLSITGGCCDCATNGVGFVWTCGEDCRCAGFSRNMSALVTWEGYSRAFPWRGRCPCAPVGDSPSVALSFSPKVVFFEDAYENAYGETVSAQSTTTTLAGLVYGGETGGTYSLTVSEGGDLLDIDRSAFPSSARIAPFDYAEIRLDSRAVSGSASVNDIVATLVFQPDGGAERISAEARATSVKIETFTDCAWIPNVHRKELGVGESVTVAFSPDSLELPIEASGCTHGNLMWRYTAPGKAQSDEVRISCQGAEYPISFTILEPESLLAERVWCTTNEIPGVAGNFMGDFDLYLLPTNVSFGSVLTAELGFAATNAVGYFALPEQSGLLDHSLHGANVWHGVGERNSFFDLVALGRIQEPWGNGGSFTWPVENAWRMRTSAPATNRLAWLESYDQRFELDADGTSRISKFGFTLQQCTNLEFSVSRKGGL